MPGFWRPALLLVLVVIALAIPQAALLPLLDRDEPRFAEASREMLQSGNYIVPTFNFAPRYAKPPLIYWCQAAAFCVFGEDAFAARLPSLLAVAGTALLLLAWGRALESHAAGLIAACAYAFSLQVMQQGRVATADALLVFFMTLAGYSGWRLLAIARESRPGGSWNGWGLTLAIGFGGGFFAKGPEALLPIMPLLFSARGLGGKTTGAFVALLALGLIPVAAWAIPAYAETHGAYWREGLGHDVGDRMVTGFQGHGASTFGWYLLGLPFYLLTFWLSALPWSPFLAARGRRLWQAASPNWTDGYLLANAAVVFVVFSLMVTKLPHYTLPAFPFLALFFGRRWIRAGLAWRGLLRVMVIFATAIAGFTCLAVPPELQNGMNPSPVGTLVREAGHDLTSDTRVAMADFREPNAVWETRQIVRAPLDEISTANVASYLRQPGARAVILSRAVLAGIPVDPAWRIYRAQGFNAARPMRHSQLARLDLALVIKR
jgi:4-amino-4-deoxy-L-arabinose transferase-like glycosyltransferase